MSWFRVPLVWQMYGHLDVEADSLQEAIEYAPNRNLTIHAPAGSYAETYAKRNNIPFQAL